MLRFVTYLTKVGRGMGTLRTSKYFTHIWYTQNLPIISSDKKDLKFVAR